MNDLLSAVKLVKFCSWEDSVADKIVEVRAREVEFLRKLHLLKGFNDIISIVAPASIIYVLVCFSFGTFYFVLVDYIHFSFWYRFSSFEGFFFNHNFERY